MDSDLVRRAQKGDENAFARLVEAIGPRVPNVGDPDSSPSDADRSPATPGGSDLRQWLAAGDIPAGMHVVEDPLPLRITLALPEGMELFTIMHREVGLCLGPCGDGYSGIDIWVPEVAAVDPCRVASGLMDPLSGATDDLVAYLTSQDLLNIRGPEPSIIGGHPATYLEMVATEGITDCDRGVLRLNGARTETGQLVHLLRAPGTVGQMWITEVAGVLVAIDLVVTPETTAEEIALLREVVESMRIEPRAG